MFRIEYLTFHQIFYRIYSKAWFIHISLCHKSYMENKEVKFKWTVCTNKLYNVCDVYRNSVMSQKPSCFLDSAGRRKSIAHMHEIFPDVSAIAEQFIFLMRTIGTSSACFLLLTRSYRQENRIKRMVQPAINPRPRTETLPTGRIYFMAIYLIPVRTTASPRLSPWN